MHRFFYVEGSRHPMFTRPTEHQADLRWESIVSQRQLREQGKYATLDIYSSKEIVGSLAIGLFYTRNTRSEMDGFLLLAGILLRLLLDRWIDLLG